MGQATSTSDATLPIAKAQKADPMYAAVERGKQGRSEASLLSKLVAESLGTFVLVFTVGCTVLLHPGSPWNATAIACALMIMIYALGPISGGNFNPAVSLALGLLKELDWATVQLYWVAQIMGGFCAGIWYSALLDQALPLQPAFPTIFACIAEVIYTFMLCFVVLSCAASKKNNPRDDVNQFFGLAIGFVIVAGGYAAEGISGACFNPAVAIGIASFNGASWGIAALYTLCELFAAALAFGTFRLVHGASEEGWEPSLASKCVSEWLGTFLLVLTVGLNLCTSSVATAWCAAAALMCMIYSLRHISGANFNPAVTVAIWLRGKHAGVVAMAYILTQFFAACCAGLVSEVFHLNGGLAQDTRISFPINATMLEGAGAELMFTAVLAFVVLSMTTATPSVSRTSTNNFVALAVASCVTAGGFAIGTLSGGELNPALSLSILLGDSVHQAIRPKSGVAPAYFRCCIYMLAEFIGGILAAGMFFVIHTHDVKQYDNLYGENPDDAAPSESSHEYTAKSA